MKDRDILARANGEATDSNTGGEEKLLQRRPRGRPKGSRNKFSASSKEVLEKFGPAVAEAICKFALGKPITRINAKGQREKISPNIDQMQTSQKLVVERLVAAVKATELTGKDGEALIPKVNDAPDNRKLARVVLGILGHAQMDEGDANGEVAPNDSATDRMLTSMVVLESKAGEGGAFDSKSGASVGPPSSDDGEPNEGMILENSAGLLWDEERGKWRIYDWKDKFHGYRRSRVEAERFAEGLPGPPP